MKDPSLRGWTSRLPGAWSLDTLGVSGWALYLALMPRADARLFAMDDERLRPGYRCWGSEGGGFAVVDFVDVGDVGSFGGGVEVASFPCSWASFSSSGVSSVLAWRGRPMGSLSSSDRRLWCASSSLRVRRASMLLVEREALANSPAAWVCSLMATVVSAVWVAIAAARAWSCA